MPYFRNDDLALHYVEMGSGAPLILLHGFGMSARSCWIDTGVAERLASAGHHLFVMDARGHGESDKPTDPAAYDADRMMGDVLALMDYAGLEIAGFVGHSMGGRTVLNILAEHARRGQSSVVVSNGSNVFQSPQTGAMADAFATGETANLPGPLVEFVTMLLDMGNDRAALAAYCRNPRPALTKDYLAAISAPIRVVCGDEDPIVGNPGQLRDALRGADLVMIKGCEHTDVLASPMFQNTALEWLG